MKLSKALRLSNTSRVAFVGAGGKTSALTILTQELKKPLLVSTTTHLGIWQTGFTDEHIIVSEDTDWDFIESKLLNRSLLLTQNPEGNRLKGLSIDQVNMAHEICNKRQIPFLLECDGSRQLPLKAPRDKEPMIPEFINTVVIVAGLSGVGNPLDENTVFNPDQFSKLGDLPLGDTITMETLEKFLVHKQGGLKNIPPQARKVLLLNQAFTPTLQIQAAKISRKVQKSFNGIIIAELDRNMIHSVIEPSAAIILAAGSALRYGQTKQLLDFHGETFIAAVTRSAINAGMNPIVVVTGADSFSVISSLSEFSPYITIIHNPIWQKGQSTSIRAGLKTLANNIDSRSFAHDSDLDPEYPGSVIFLLADQPQVTPQLLRLLVEEHSHSLSPVIAPLVDHQRTNPVLFDRETFKDLMDLEGDIGGRGIFSKYSPSYLEWNDNSLTFDVDDQEDYERLLIDQS